MAGENGHLERPASPQEIEEALDRLYKGTTNVAIQAADLGIPLERLKQLFGKYVAARPIDVNDEDVWLGDTTLCWPYA
jgi:hypothetical protein